MLTSVQVSTRSLAFTIVIVAVFGTGQGRHRLLADWMGLIYTLLGAPGYFSILIIPACTLVVLQ
jgi:hypothetical protein